MKHYFKKISRSLKKQVLVIIIDILLIKKDCKTKKPVSWCHETGLNKLLLSIRIKLFLIGIKLL